MSTNMQVADSDSSESVYGTLIRSTAEPVTIRGDGSVTLFGLNNRYSTVIPGRLRTRLSPEEFADTILVINKVLRRNFVNSVFWFFCGCIAFCCTLGCSMCPVIYFNKRTIRSLNRTLKCENDRLYHKLGMHWSLQKVNVGQSNLVEYEILINFLPKPEIYIPD